MRQLYVQDLRFALRMYGRTPVFHWNLRAFAGDGHRWKCRHVLAGERLAGSPFAIQRSPNAWFAITGIYPRAGLPFFQARARTMDIAAVSTGSEFNLTGQGPADSVTGSMASPDFLSVLGAPVAGEEASTREKSRPGATTS